MIENPAARAAFEREAQGRGVPRATFAMGCFWEAESVFGRVKGVQSTGAVYVGAPWIK